MWTAGPAQRLYWYYCAVSHKLTCGRAVVHGFRIRVQISSTRTRKQCTRTCTRLLSTRTWTMSTRTHGTSTRFEPLVFIFSVYTHISNYDGIVQITATRFYAIMFSALSV